MSTELLNERQVESRYGLGVAWQRRVRRERRGPRYLKLGKMVRYRESDIEAYLDACAAEVAKPTTKNRTQPKGNR